MVLRSALPALSSVERAKAALVAAFRTPRQLKADLEPLQGLIRPAAGPGLECLGAIVLVAEALDRTRSRAITDVSLMRAREGWSLVLQASGEEPFELSLLDEPLARLGKILKEPVAPVLKLPEAAAR
jgi:exopolyphosphatase/guanosine-5'-triphosphate,3'-diphosphate pyrophosphatase